MCNANYAYGKTTTLLLLEKKLTATGYLPIPIG
jgi:hypothetical protein